MSLAQLVIIATILSLVTPLLVALLKYSRDIKPGKSKIARAMDIQEMSFDLAEQLRIDYAAASAKVQELTDQLDTLIIRARLAEAEREDAYELLRDRGIPLPARRIPPSAPPG